MSYSKFKYIFFVISLILFSGSLAAQNKVVVIPMAGEDLKPLANIVTVAKANGDFTDPLAAMNSIADASETNPYLIVIAPGVYDIGSDKLVMKPFVSVAGSGPKISVVTGTGIELVELSDDSFLQDLSLMLTGSSTATQTVIDGYRSDRAIIENVHAVLDNDSSLSRRVLHVRGSQDTIIRNSILEVTGSVAGTAVGIGGSGAGPDILVSNTIISLPNSSDDPITPNQGGTVEAVCDSVSFVFEDSFFGRSFGDRVLLDEACN